MRFRNRLLIGGMLALLSALPALAGPVDVHQAGDVARAFFRYDPNAGRRMAPLTHVDLYDAPLTKAGDPAPAFHIFNREGGGFVIIAGDDACKPILGYSFEGSFGPADQLPDGMKDWLGDFEKQVAVVRTQGTSQKALENAQEAWMEILYPTKAGGGYQAEALHKTAEWNQSDPYNRLCHKIDGKASLVGCIPLAMGIIMDFFCYPAQGKGTLESYSYDAWGYVDSVTGFDLGHPYEWSKFHGVNFKEGFTDEQADAVAVLLRDIGVAGHAYYMPESTDDDFWRLTPAIIEHFGYDPNVSHLKRKFFTDEEWMGMLKNDLQDHPVLYAASREGGGHGFVVDGYDKKNNLHINWGWKGSYNGYFALSAFAPLEGHNYEFEHTVVLGLVPDKGQGGQPEEFLYYYPSTGSDGVFYPGLMAHETPVRDKAFKMSATWLSNGGITPIKGKYFFALVDGNGDIVEKVSQEKSFDSVEPKKYLSIWKIDCKISSYPMAGDKLKLFYRSDNWPEGVWKTPLVNSEEPRTVFEIDVAPDESKLADVTSFKYDKSSGKVEMKTKDRVQWSLKKSSGAALRSGVSEGFAISVPTADLTLDNYTLTLMRGDEKQTITVKMGKK